MPYITKKQGSKYVVYKKKRDGSTGEKVGSTEGNKEALRKYLAALHINAKESVTENMDFETAKREAQKISSEEGVVQHVNRQRDGSYKVSDWYDSDETEVSYEFGRQLAESHLNKISKLRELIAESIREVLAEKKIQPNKKKKTKSSTEKEAEKITKAAEKQSKSYIKKKYGNKFDTMIEKTSTKLKEILNSED